MDKWIDIDIDIDINGVDIYIIYMYIYIYIVYIHTCILSRLVQVLRFRHTHMHACNVCMCTHINK